MSSKNQMNLALSETLVERLDELADEMEMTRSELARLILAQYLSGKLELTIKDASAADRLAAMTGRWPHSTERSKNGR